jgi:SAM-dependent methyltransferase
MDKLLKAKLIHPIDFDPSLHPSIKLFRSLELKTIYQNLKKTKLLQPSLDLGCGDGYIANLLFGSQLTYGLDNNEAEDVQVAIKNKIYNKVLIATAEKIPLKPSSLNTVFSNSVIEHIPDNEAVLSEVARLLKPGGKFVFTAPCHNFTKFIMSSFPLPRPLAKLFTIKRNKMLNHYHLYSDSEWRKRLYSHQLRIIKYAYYISKSALIKWNQIALEAVIKKTFDSHAIVKLAQKYQYLVNDIYERDSIKNNQGACIFIIAQKT